jgi:hypothetical protein
MFQRGSTFAAFDRMARSTAHLLHVMDELRRAGVEFISLREQIDTGGPLGRAITTIVGAVAELERSLIIERVKSGLARAKASGTRLGRPGVLTALEAGDFVAERQQLGTAAMAAKYNVSRRAIRMHAAKLRAEEGRKKTPSKTGAGELGARTLCTNQQVCDRARFNAPRQRRFVGDTFVSLIRGWIRSCGAPTHSLGLSTPVSVGHPPRSLKNAANSRDRFRDSLPKTV